jgi:hypothetical protein
MVTLLIDFNKIILDHDLSLIKEKINPFPNTEHKIGVILIIPDKKLIKLKKLSKGKPRVNYINSIDFVNSIESFTYFIYNNKICEILLKNYKMLNVILDCLYKNLPRNILLWISIKFDEKNKLNKVVKNNFKEPYISNKSLLDNNLVGYQICMSKKNNNKEKYNSKNEVKYVLNQFLLRDNCEMACKLDKNSVVFLKNICKTSKNNEISGSFKVNKINKDLVSIFGIDSKSIIKGKQDEVNVSESLYNFHSHPYNSYIKHDVKLAWPSSQDYVAFLTSNIEYNTLFHIITTLEGLYIISISKFSINKVNKNMIPFIKNNYNFCYKKGDTISWYLDKISDITYNNMPLFNVNYLSWKNSRNIFNIFYNKTENNCYYK